jgi:hypothetical protein
MSYLNCPACHLSLQARHGHHELCPRCLRRDSERVPMFASPLPYRLLTGSILDASAGRSAKPKWGVRE